jgi:hypothetical protein
MRRIVGVEQLGSVVAWVVNLPGNPMPCHWSRVGWLEQYPGVRLNPHCPDRARRHSYRAHSWLAPGHGSLPHLVGIRDGNGIELDVVGLECHALAAMSPYP